MAFPIKFGGGELKQRAMRGSALTIIGFGFNNLFRLLSNIILTRILFPEAFGLMALVQVIISGVQLFSTIGIGLSIIQSERGDEPEFLNTAFTIQLLRGVLLWLLLCALAVPMANFYDAPQLAAILPVAALQAIFAGMQSTNFVTANRHLMLGRRTLLELGCQLFGIVVMVVLAFKWQSVWALVIGGAAGQALQALLSHVVLKGIRNRLHWDPAAFHSIVRFGKFVFLSTMATFLLQQGDRAILGRFVPLDILGVYNIGMFLGTMPFLLMGAMTTKIFLPLYRMSPPQESARNMRNMLRARRGLMAGLIGLVIMLGFGGVALVDLLYGQAYRLAGPMIVVFSLAIVPRLIGADYDAATLARGDSLGSFIIQGSTAALQVVFIYLGLRWYDLFGAIVAPGLAAALTYPLRASYARRYGALDLRGDIALLVLGLVGTGLALSWYWADITPLFAAGRQAAGG